MDYSTPYVLGCVVLALLIVLALALYIFKAAGNNARDWNTARDGDFQRAFLTHLASYWSSNDPLLRETLSKILTSWSERDCGGVILQEKSSNNNSNKGKFQMIDFYGPSKSGAGIPVVEIQWSYTSSRQLALTFLNEEKVETILCEPRIFRAMFEHLSRYCRYNGNIDAFSKCKVYEGYLCPNK
jgi:hypothetical protein